MFHIAVGTDGKQIVTADCLNADHATWGTEFIVVDQTNPRSVFLIQGHGKEWHFRDKLSPDRTRLIGETTRGQFLPNKLIRVEQPEPKNSAVGEFLSLPS